LKYKLKLLEEHISSQHFEVVVSCNDDVPRTKPFADGIQLALSRLEVAPHEAVLIGDSVDDIGAGQAAEVPVLIVNRGQLASIFDFMEKREMKADFGIIDSLYDLPKALNLAERPDEEARAA
jgi:phosphoglycolate phosphatase-like HAD superfamily hydrolase